MVVPKILVLTMCHSCRCGCNATYTKAALANVQAICCPYSKDKTVYGACIDGVPPLPIIKIVRTKTQHLPQLTARLAVWPRSAGGAPAVGGSPGPLQCKRFPPQPSTPPIARSAAGSAAPQCELSVGCGGVLFAVFADLNGGMVSSDCGFGAEFTDGNRAANPSLGYTSMSYQMSAGGSVPQRGSACQVSTRILGRRTAPFPPFLYSLPRPAWFYPNILVVVSTPRPSSSCLPCRRRSSRPRWPCAPTRSSTTPPCSASTRPAAATCRCAVFGYPPEH